MIPKENHFHILYVDLSSGFPCSRILWISILIIHELTPNIQSMKDYKEESLCKFVSIGLIVKVYKDKTILHNDYYEDK